jgi:hypothetical protein
MQNWQRIERVVRWTGLSVNSFALAIGLNRAENLYQIKRGNNGISRELAGMIATKYPQISRGWLLTGEGSMLAGERVGQDSVPFFDIDVEKYVAAPTKFVAAGYISLPTVDDVDFAALYNGRAMGGEIPSGSMVLVKKVDNVIPGGDYVIVTEDFTMLRRVRRDVASDTLRLLPVDTENFDEIRLEPTKIRELYLVKSVIINRYV